MTDPAYERAVHYLEAGWTYVQRGVDDHMLVDPNTQYELDLTLEQVRRLQAENLLPPVEM